MWALALVVALLSTPAAVSSAAAAAGSAVLAAAPTDPPAPPPPSPPVWPPVFHAVLFQEDEPRPATAAASAAVAPPSSPPPSLPTAPPPQPAGGAVVDLYYDFPRGRNANLIRGRLGDSVLVDVEYDNHTSFYFDRAARTCKSVTFPVGVLPPDWLAGATYHGRRTVDGVATDLWAKAGFIEYWARVGDGAPLQWRFSADAGGPMLMRVLRWEVGGGVGRGRVAGAGVLFRGRGG